MLYAGMLTAQQVKTVGVLDITRGALFTTRLYNQSQILKKARAGLFEIA